MTPAQRKVLSRALLVLGAISGSILVPVVWVGFLSEPPHPRNAPQVLLAFFATTFASITAGLYVRAGGKRPPPNA